MQEIILMLNKVLVNQAEIKRSLITEKCDTDSRAESNKKNFDFLQLTNSLPLKNEDEVQKLEKQLHTESFKCGVVAIK